MMRGIEMKDVIFHKGGEVLVLAVFHRYTLIATSLAPVDKR